MCDGVFLPHGVKRHLTAVFDSAQILNYMLKSDRAVCANEIQMVLPLSNAIIKSRLTRMKNLGIVSPEYINKNSQYSKWSVPAGLQKPLKEFMESEYGSEIQPVKV